MGRRLYNLRNSARYWRYRAMNVLRRWLLRFVVGRDTYDLMYRCLLQDLRVVNAHMIDVVVRCDGRERRTQADWVGHLARVIHDEKRPPPPVDINVYRSTIARANASAYMQRR